jgi:hypothetical protein
LVFKKLKAFNHEGILGGGTALSLQIGHRISFDFDIFMEKAVDDKLWKKAKEIFGKSSEKLIETGEELHMTTPENIGVTFLHDDFKLLLPPVKTQIVNLLNVKDIAANKAYTLGKRPKWRDYVDIYFLLKDKYLSLETLILLSGKKFGNDFSERLFLEQLIYWKDIVDFEIEYIRVHVKPKTIKSFLEKEVDKYKKGQFQP